MTREEAIKELQLIAKITMWNDRREAVEMAIKALEDRPTVDREYLIDLIQEAVYDGEACAKLIDLVDRPTGWILVSERLPETGEQVLCCDCQSRVFTSALTEIASNGMTFFGKHCKVIAWMPLPEPYKGGESDG